MLVGDGSDASCGPQLASQYEFKDGDDEGLVGSSSDNGKCIYDSNVEFGLEVNCSPKSIIDSIYFLTCFTASK